METARRWRITAAILGLALVGVVWSGQAAAPAKSYVGLQVTMLAPASPQTGAAKVLLTRLRADGVVEACMIETYGVFNCEPADLAQSNWVRLGEERCR